MSMKYLKQLFFLSILCSLVLFTNCGEVSDDVIDDKKSAEAPIYFAENGVTIKASDNAVNGESYELDGISYLVVDSAILYKMAEGNENVENVVTTNITNMKGLFNGLTSFNQNIKSWDVSNVTDMAGMFGRVTYFTKNIGSWDVSNVCLLYTSPSPRD